MFGYPDHMIEQTYDLGTMVADVGASVQCVPPCVPECTRVHPWENE